MDRIRDTEVGGSRGNIPYPGIYVGGDCMCNDRVGFDFLKFLSYSLQGLYLFLLEFPVIAGETMVISVFFLGTDGACWCDYSWVRDLM